MRINRIFCGVLAAVTAFSCALPVFARSGGNLKLDALLNLDNKSSAEGLIDSANKEYAVCDSDGDPINTIGSGFSTKSTAGNLTFDGINPSQTLHIYLGADSDKTDLSQYFENDSGESPDFVIRTADLANENVMNLRTSATGDGKDLFAGISQSSSKTMAGFDRGSWLKLMMFDIASTDERKINITLTFSTKQASSSDSFEGNEIDAGYSSQLQITLWLNNTKISSGAGESETGDRVFFDPQSAGNNQLIWGKDRAALKFSADSEGKEFYSRLSDTIDNNIYYDYGDAVSAELYFYDFVTHSQIPATSRAMLTLGIPWEDDAEYKPSPQTCRIYQQDVMGRLTDVTELFTYSETEEAIPGWSMQVRKLDSYVISDVPLLVQEKADSYSDVYFYSDAELDDLFAIDPALSLRMQTAYINKTMQDRLLGILTTGIGGADGQDRVGEILGVKPNSSDVDDIVSEIDHDSIQGRVDQIIS